MCIWNRVEETVGETFYTEAWPSQSFHELKILELGERSLRPGTRNQHDIESTSHFNRNGFPVARFPYHGERQGLVKTLRN